MAEDEATSETTPANDLLSSRRRLPWRDWLTDSAVRAGGYGVIATIILLFGYLLMVAAPLFVGASIGAPVVVAEEALDEIVLTDADDSAERVMLLDRAGTVRYLDAGVVSGVAAGNGGPLSRRGIGTVAISQRVAGVEHIYAMLAEDGHMAFYQSQFSTSFSTGQRVLRATLAALFDEQTLDLELAGEVPRSLDVAWVSNDVLVVAALQGELVVARLPDADPDFELPDARLLRHPLAPSVESAHIGPRGRWLYLVHDDASVEIMRVGRRTLSSIERVAVTEDGAAIEARAFLSGDESLLIGDSNGRIGQWLLVRSQDAGGFRLQRVRLFDVGAVPVRIIPEQRRKGFAVITADAELSLFHATTHRRLARAAFPLTDPSAVAFSLDASALVAVDSQGRLLRIPIDNRHPEISFAALWQQIWYEGYEAPDFVWQSTATDNAFEPKFSLTPLLFGTLKAASYALLFAVPLAVLAAIYTGFFMAPAMRRYVKPGIELMAALPTVILGFLAGLWLAPLIERNLAALFAGVLVLPVGLLLLAWLFQTLPLALQRRAGGWYALFSVPVVVLLAWLAVELGPVLEHALFAGDTRAWLLDTWGIDYDQRNALVVGVAMGLAVMPTIFAIAEDAIHGVPGHLRAGSLALGATQWQTLTRVVLLAASPGILSAVMVGMGRAIGETMIVLMATGNTPIMEVNIFEGMRTFAANIAVELPESERDSSHFRLLFLTALVLFLITFAFNTLAEVVRGRLRARYGRLA